MDHGKGLATAVAKGLAFSAGYCVAYLVLRYYSFDQWFLPAGLRAACFFFLPFRYWPFIFIGDAAAVLYGRVPKAHKYDPLWVYAGPFLLITAGSIVPYLLRKHLRTPLLIARRLPLAAASTAAWSAVCTISLNILLGGPSDSLSFTFVANNFFGNYLGTLLLVLPVLIWMKAIRHTGELKPVLRDTALAVAFIGAMFIYLEYWHQTDDALRKAILMTMIIPALFLTYFHGWIGAAAGVIFVNFGIAQTMTYTGQTGAQDESVLLAQIGLAIAASALLILGARITSHFEQAMRAGVAEAEAKKISHFAMLSSESAARDQVLYLAQLQILIDDERRDLIQWLKANGKHREALDLNNSGAQQRQLFRGHTLAVYPIAIEEKGLFAVVQSQAFEDFWAGGTPLVIRFDDGSPKILSVGLQLVAYRCLCSAVVLMGDWKPEELHLRMRVWRTTSRRGIYFSVSAYLPGTAEISQAGTAASLLLNARVGAHGGIIRRHTHRVSVLLSERSGESQ